MERRCARHAVASQWIRISQFRESISAIDRWRTRALLHWNILADAFAVWPFSAVSLQQMLANQSQGKTFHRKRRRLLMEYNYWYNSNATMAWSTRRVSHTYRTTRTEMHEWHAARHSSVEAVSKHICRYRSCLGEVSLRHGPSILFRWPFTCGCSSESWNTHWRFQPGKLTFAFHQKKRRLLMAYNHWSNSNATMFGTNILHIRREETAWSTLHVGKVRGQEECRTWHDGNSQDR